MVYGQEPPVLNPALESRTQCSRTLNSYLLWTRRGRGIGSKIVELRLTPERNGELRHLAEQHKSVHTHCEATAYKTLLPPRHARAPVLGDTVRETVKTARGPAVSGRGVVEREGLDF